MHHIRSFRPCLQGMDTFDDVANIQPKTRQLVYSFSNNYPDTTPSGVDETSFKVPDMSEATSTLWLKQKLKRDKIVSFYRYLNVTGDPGLADLDRFTIKKS